MKILLVLSLLFLQKAAEGASSTVDTSTPISTEPPTSDPASSVVSSTDADATTASSVVETSTADSSNGTTPNGSVAVRYGLPSAAIVFLTSILQFVVNGY